MAAVVKSTKAGYDAYSFAKCPVNIPGLLTAGPGKKFEKLDPVYIDSDGKVTPAYDDTTGIKFDGFAMSANDSDGGLPCTIAGFGLKMEWLEDSDSYTPGTKFYVGATNQLETTGTTAVAMAYTNKNIIVIAPPGIRA